MLDTAISRPHITHNYLLLSNKIPPILDTLPCMRLKSQNILAHTLYFLQMLRELPVLVACEGAFPAVSFPIGRRLLLLLGDVVLSEDLGSYCHVICIRLGWGVLTPGMKWDRLFPVYLLVTLSVELASPNNGLLAYIVSYCIFGEFINTFTRNATLDTDGKYHGQLIPFTTTFAI